MDKLSLFSMLCSVTAALQLWRNQLISTSVRCGPVDQFRMELEPKLIALQKRQK